MLLTESSKGSLMGNAENENILILLRFNIMDLLGFIQIILQLQQLCKRIFLMREFSMLQHSKNCTCFALLVQLNLGARVGASFLQTAAQVLDVAGQDGPVLFGFRAVSFKKELSPVIQEMICNSS